MLCTHHRTDTKMCLLKDSSGVVWFFLAFTTFGGGSVTATISLALKVASASFNKTRGHERKVIWPTRKR
ncbi:Uncharacterized protein APZ42_033149 [Daphnia magna]|uniref:Uncharacterized protein n=1 Tax=Daphnia magna TaxID=35525 RepID=A0A164LEY9_9CRUS|nr:Uncharacterized protein APZ42_033149 [Daphnia magna]